MGAQPSADFSTRLKAVATETEALLERLLSAQPPAGEISRPERLLAAMRYATLGGGKRLRPFLLVESAALFDVPREQALMAGAALECVHCYSLAHDDLPAMDNDALRRGQPTTHKQFDEATAILAGDALLTFAFDILARDDVHPDAAVRIALVSELARAAGVGGMAGGQMLDLAAEGRFEKTSFDENDILQMQEMKTGALLRFACCAGAILGQADRASLAALNRYGAAVGRAFQIADDLLDVEGNAKLTGKATGKDAAAGKATLVGTFGAPGARAVLMTLMLEAEKAIAPFGAKADMLRAAALFIAKRQQ